MKSLVSRHLLHQKTGQKLYSTTESSGSAEKDFDNEWKSLAVEPFNAESKPASETLTLPDGWKTISAASFAKQNGVNSYVVLTVYSGFGKTTSVLANLNDQLYVTELDKFLEGIKLDKNSLPEKTENQPVQNNSIFIGKWGKSASSPSAYINGRINNLAYAGYTKGQYDCHQQVS